MMTSAFVHSVETLNKLLDYIELPFTKNHMHWLFPMTLFGISQSYQRLSPGCSPYILIQINLTSSSHMHLFLVDEYRIQWSDSEWTFSHLVGLYEEPGTLISAVSLCTYPPPQESSEFSYVSPKFLDSSHILLMTHSWYGAGYCSLPGGRHQGVACEIYLVLSPASGGTGLTEA